MSDVQVVSTTDKPAAVTAATGGLAPEKVKETKPEATAEGASEQALEASEIEESDPSEMPEEAEATEGEEDDAENDEASEERPKKKGGFKRRIDKLNARNAEKDREIQYLREQLAKQNPGEKQPEQKAAPQTGSEGKPSPDDFETHADYVEALTDWKLDQKDKAKEAKSKEEQAKAASQKAFESHSDRVRNFAEKHDDFFEVIEDCDVIMPVGVQQAIVESDLGPELMYELAKQPELAEKISRLGHIAALREIGKLESRIEAKSASAKEEIKEVKKSKAPTPITPVGSKAKVAAKSYDEMDYEEYRAARAEEERKARRR